MGFGANEKHFKFFQSLNLKKLCRKGPISKTHIPRKKGLWGPTLGGWVLAFATQGEVKEGSLAVGHRFEEF